MLKKSTIIKLSNPHLFQQIKINLSPHRKFSQIEARIILKQNRDRLFHHPKTRNFRFFLKLAREAFQREDYNEAFFLINKTIDLLPQSSLSKADPSNLNNLNNMSSPNNISNTNNMSSPNNISNTKGPIDLDTARIYELAGNIYKKNYRIQGSIDLLERSLGILSKTLGEDTIYSKDLVFQLADSYLQNYRGSEAILYFVKYLKLKNPHILKFDRIDMGIIVLIGLAYYYKNGPKIALRLYKEILRFSENSLRKHNTIQLHTLFEIATIYKDARKIDKAKKYYRQSLNRIGKSYFNHEISKVYMCKILIDYYCALEMYDHSLIFAKKTIKMLKQSKKYEIYHIIFIHRSISIIYIAKDNKRMFFHYYKKYLILLKKLVGTEHPLFLKSSLFYPEILLMLKEQYKKSLKRLKRTKERLKRVFELNNFYKAKYKYLKGLIYALLKWTEKSSQKLEEAKNLFFENNGKNHPSYIHCCETIADNLAHQNYLDEALAIYYTVFESYQRLYSYFHYVCARVLFQIGRIYLKLGKASSSLECFERALDIFNNLNRRNTYCTKLVNLSMAELYLYQAKHQQFYYYLKTSLDIEAEDNFNRHGYFVHLLMIIAQYFDRNKRYQLARRVAIKMLKSHVNSDQYNHSQTIELALNLATCEINIGNKRSFSNATKLYLISRDLYIKLIEKHKIPQRNHLIIQIYMLKAELYKSLNKNEDCLNTLRRALNLRRHFYKKNNYQMLELYWNMSMVLFKMNKSEECIVMCKRILKIQLKTFVNPLKISGIYYMLDFGYFYLKKFDKALEYAKKGLKLNKHIYASTDSELKDWYLRVGTCYFEQNQLERALKYFLKAFSNTVISTSMSIEDSCILNNIGNLLAFKGLIYEAVYIFNSCLESAKTNKCRSEFVQMFSSNLQQIENAIKIRPEYNNGKLNDQQISHGIVLDLEYVLTNKKD